MKVEEILNILSHEFPSPKSDLDYKNPFELMIAVTLSAQTTDLMVNRVTPALFERYPDPLSLSQADVKDVEKLINKIGLYRNKARFIIAASRILVEDFNGVVPRTRKQLMKLPGVGRKTANVVLAEGFKIPAIAVDTHVDRVSKRLKLAKDGDSVLVIEEKLKRKIPREQWADAHHLLLLFGRYHSTASNKENAFTLLEQLKEKHGL